jgi:uncharacterized phage protein (TIGR01671 family)
MLDDEQVKSELVSDMKFSSLFWLGDGIIPMQYTGLKDKNSKEIYEGDIVKKSYGDIPHLPVNFTQEVKFGEEDVDATCWESFEITITGFYLTNYDGDKDRYESLNKDVSERLEVIGNIYESPELLVINQ